MQYLVIMGILIAVAVILIIIIIAALMKNRQDDGEDYEDDDEDYDYDEGYGEEAGEAPQDMDGAYDEQEEPEHEEGPVIVGQGRRPREGAPGRDGQNRPGEARGANRPSGKKLWKLSIENLSTWQKSTFVFYENLGIGRGRSFPQFEKFMSIGDDPRDDVIGMGETEIEVQSMMREK